MKKYTFSTPPGQSIDRKLYLCCGNYGSANDPEWGRIGKHVEDSSAEMDWGEETKKNILGDTWTTMKTPVITQPFDPSDLDSGDKYQEHIWNLAVVEQNAAELCNQDLLRIHMYAVDENKQPFAERFHSSMVKPTGLGGAGGGNLTMPIDVTFGGEREIGTVTIDSNKKITFTPFTDEGVAVLEDKKMAEEGSIL